jgi:hypothetical protein
MKIKFDLRTQLKFQIKINSENHIPYPKQLYPIGFHFHFHFISFINSIKIQKP